MHIYSYTPHIFRWTWGTHQKNGLWEISHNCKSLPISCEKKHTEIAHQELLSFSRQISSFGRNVQQFHYFVRVFSPHTNTHFSNSTNNNTTNCKHLILTDHMWYLNAWTETHNTKHLWFCCLLTVYRQNKMNKNNIANLQFERLKRKKKKKMNAIFLFVWCVFCIFEQSKDSFSYALCQFWKVCEESKIQFVCENRNTNYDYSLSLVAVHLIYLTWVKLERQRKWTKGKE